METEKKKIIEAEMIIGNGFCLAIDGVCALIDFSGIGLFLSPVIQSFGIFVIDQWVGSKGGGTPGLGKKIAKYASGILPVLPTTTAVFNIEVFLHNHENVLGAVETVAKTKAIASKTMKTARM